MESESLSPSRRRFFLATMLGGIGAALAVAAGWPVWRYLSPADATGERAKATLPRAQIEVGIAHFFQFRGHPAVVLQKAPGEFVAFSAVCTHLGCIVQWLADKQEFFCPCHAGRFSRDGKVLGGPPPKPLQAIPVVLAGDDILVG